MRGYFGIGIEHTKTPVNIGTLWRSAAILGAAFIFTIGRRYKSQASDTIKAHKHIPLFHFQTIDQLFNHLPHSCPLIGLELHPKALKIAEFYHPDRACYLLGAEDYGLSKEAIQKCHQLIQLPGDQSMNVSVAGSIVMFDRIQQIAKRPMMMRGKGIHGS